MSWLQRVFSLMSTSNLQPESALGSYAMQLASPSAAYTEQPSLRSDQPRPFPIEYQGLKGEYDPQGLAKRVAQAFDRHPQTRDIDTLCILQQGGQISLLGKVKTEQQLQQVIELARQVEGTQAVDVSQVFVHSGEP